MSSYANLITRPSKAIFVVIMRVMADTADVSDFRVMFVSETGCLFYPFHTDIAMTVIMARKKYTLH